MPIFRSSAVVVLTIVVTCVAGAPSRIQDSNIVAYMDAVLSRAEIDKAMGRNQEPLDWSSRIRRGEIIDETTRNLDHIGGGNLHRNLDPIGGGNLLSSVYTREKSGTNQFSSRDKSNQVTRKPDSQGLIDQKLGFSNGNRRSVIDEGDLQSSFDESIGGNLLKESQFNKLDKSRWARNLASINDRLDHDIRKSGFNDDFSNQEYKQDGENLFQRRVIVENNLVPVSEYTQDGNFLKELQLEKQDRRSGSPATIDKGLNYGLTKLLRYPDYLDERDKEYRIFDVIGIDNLDQRDVVDLNKQERNLDHIGGGNLLRDLADQGEYRVVRLDK